MPGGAERMTPFDDAWTAESGNFGTPCERTQAAKASALCSGELPPELLEVEGAAGPYVVLVVEPVFAVAFGEPPQAATSMARPPSAATRMEGDQARFLPLSGVELPPARIRFMTFLPVAERSPHRQPLKMAVTTARAILIALIS